MFPERPGNPGANPAPTQIDRPVVRDFRVTGDMLAMPLLPQLPSLSRESHPVCGVVYPTISTA